MNFRVTKRIRLKMKLKIGRTEKSTQSPAQTTALRKRARVQRKAALGINSISEEGKTMVHFYKEEPSRLPFLLRPILKRRSMSNKWS